MIDRIAKAIGDAIDPTSGDPIGVTFHHSEFVEGQTMQEQLEQVKSICLSAARAAIEAMPLEKMIIEAYLRGVEWKEENPLDLDREYRFKAARDYADKTLSQSPSSLPSEDR